MISKVKRNTPLTIGENPDGFIFESHKYDVDIIRCYFEIKKILYTNDYLKPQFADENKKLEYLQDLKNTIEFYCKEHNLDFNFHIKNQIPLIVPSNESYYKYCLALCLISFDVLLINSLLHYQNEQYSNSENFLYLIEFVVYETVKNQSLFINDHERLKSIVQWIELERMNRPIRTKKVSKQSQNKYNFDYSDQKEINIDPNIIHELCNILSFYFNEKDLTNFESSLRGEKTPQKILFKASCIKLVDVFFKLKEKQKIIENKTEINNWICNNFLYLDKDKKPKEFDYENVKNILTGQITISKRSRINLDTLFH